MTDRRCPHCVRNPREWRDLYRSTAPGWGHPRNAPYKPWADIGPHGVYMVRHRGWLDHLYRLRRHDGRTVYVAEPYDIDSEDLDDLAELRRQGWHVSLDGDGVHHDTTMRILIYREPAA